MGRDYLAPTDRTVNRERHGATFLHTEILLMLGRLRRGPMVGQLVSALFASGRCRILSQVSAEPSLAPCQKSSNRSCGVSRAIFRRWRAVFRSVRTFFFCGPVGHFAWWKPPRYFSDSIPCPLVTARRNQISKCVRVLAIVEAPRKFVHVQRQIILAHFVIAADDAAFEEAPESFDAVGMSGADYVLAASVIDDAMVHIAAQQPISRMLVSRDEAGLSGNSLADEAVRCGGIGVLDHFRDDHSLARNRADHGNLARTASQSFALALVFVRFFPADISFVDFDFASQRHYVAFHRGAPAMADVPRGTPVGSRILAEDDAPDLKRAKALLRGDHQVANLEPEAKRDFGIFKDCVSGHAESVARAPATVFVAASPTERSLERIDSLLPFAAWASHAIRPTLQDDVGFAGFISRKSPIELFVSHHAENISENRSDCQYQQNHHPRRGSR